MVSVPAYVILICVVAFVFYFVNGLHDAANSMATVVSTRMLRPIYAAAWAAFFNFAAAFTFSVHAATTTGKGIVHEGAVKSGVILAALVGAIVWGLIIWHLGRPTSSSHALIGGLAGGWRITKTMEMRITRLQPNDHFCAETSAAISLFETTAAGALGKAISAAGHALADELGGNACA